MENKYLSLIVASMLVFTTSIKAQTDTDGQVVAYYAAWQNGETKPVKQLQAEPGTYQFFIIGEDSTQLLRNDLAAKIEKYRDEEAIVHLKVSSTTTIRILPCSEITSTRFTPITNTVIFQPDFNSQVAKK
jgi:hypothetical protein